MKESFIVILLIIASKMLFAQTGKISGTVIDAGSGQVLSGATLILNMQSKTKVTDQNGAFNFSKLPAGTYTLTVSYTGFEEKIIEEIIVKENDNTDINISLAGKKSDAVVVTAKRTRAAGETVSSLLIAQKNSANVSDGITQETIKKTPDKTSGDVIKRVSGASIQDDRFAVIRGLNDRYNAAFINGAPLPSTESDRKAFAFDIFPSAILDNLIIYKTATPDRSGEFAGGIIEISTKSSGTNKTGSFSLGQGYNSLITGKQRFFSEMKGKNDWLGLDDGTRALPAGLPSKETMQSRAFTKEHNLITAKLFENYKWGLQHANTRPNFNFQLSKGFNVNRRQEEFFSGIFSVTYNRAFAFATGERNSFDQFDPDVPATSLDFKPLQRGKYIDSIYNDEVVWALLGNIAVKINGRNSITWKNNLSVNTDNRLIRRMGNYDYDSDSLAFSRETVRWFTSDKIFTSQLAGEHQAGRIRTKFNWLASYSTVDREIPDLSRTAYIGRYPDVTTLTPISSSGLAQFAGNGTMFFSNSNEYIKNIKVDISQPYTFFKNAQNLLKIGGGYQYRDRDFSSRLLGFADYAGTVYQKDLSFASLPEDQLFLGQYLGVMANGKAGFAVADGTISNSDYHASSAISHAYIMNDQRFLKKFRLIYGVRMEKFNQKLETLRDRNDSVKLNTTVTDFLPSVNFVYALTPKTNLRLSYAETVNRPEFRELAPFLFYEYVSGFSVSGYEFLKRAKIKNYDFRYELFPGRAQLLSFSAFYKKFDNPLELVLLPDFGSQANYVNTAAAKVYGVEAEFRILFSSVFGIKNEKNILNRFTLTGNAAFMKSKVSLKEISYIPAGKLGGSRPLQGQSPYIVNSSINYTHDKAGLSSTISFNRIGDRLVIGGTYNTPDIYEKARTVIDFQVSKIFPDNKFELRFNAKDILAQRITGYFDYDKSQSFGGNDRIFASTKTPKIFSVTASCRL